MEFPCPYLEKQPMVSVDLRRIELPSGGC